MILRIVRGLIAADRLDGAVAPFAEPVMPPRSTPGLLRYHAGVRDVGDGARETVVVTLWATAEAAVDAYGMLDPVWTLDGGDEPGATREVAYFEVDESTLRRSDAEANILRVTIGRVARGLDVDIHRELRARMDGLESVMTEAYVGRRIVGDDVEIAFVSAWQGPPATRSLDAPFWPDITEQVDAYEVATYQPIASGAAVG
jgi:hypothetical protein